MKLCLRKSERWHRFDSLKYQAELGEGIPDAIAELCQRPQLQPPSSSDVVAEIKVEIKEEPILANLAPPEDCKPNPVEVIDLTLDSDDEAERERQPLAGPSHIQTSTPPPPTTTTAEPDYSFFAEDAESASLRELMECLRVEELKALAKQVKVKRTLNVRPLLSLLL